jgi:hypothetical protein
VTSLITYPTGGGYREALFDTQICFKDPVLAGSQPVLDRLGMPKPISGNFASVFTIDGTDGRRWAVKCFTRYVEDQAVRYQQISKTLQEVTSPWKVGFEYLPEGVLVQGRWYPVLKMEWVDANGLLPFIETHLSEHETLANLAKDFGCLVQDLGRHGIAHGDLQHGNILVTPSGELKLIDYDGMFVPGLDGLGASELGHANYQSPLRSAANWGPDIDRFSSWVIYASLTALAIDPSLWLTLHAEGDEALLFHKSDFTDRDSSRALFALTTSSVSQLHEIARDIDFLWAPDLGAVPPLESTSAPDGAATLKGPVPPFVVGVTASATTVSGAAPDWLRQVQEVPTARVGTLGSAGNSVGAAAWLAGHLPVAPSVDFTRLSGFTRVVCAVLLSVVILFCAGATVTALFTSVYVFFAVVTAMTVWVVSFVSYRRSPARRELQNIRLVIRERQSEAAKTSRGLAEIGKEVRKIERDADESKTAAAKKADNARSSEQRELSAVDKRLGSEIAKLSREMNALRGRANSEVQTALRHLQREHVISTMRAAKISAATIAGIGPGLKSNLAASGILSAADFTGIRYVQKSFHSTSANLVLANGRQVSPRGIGQKKAVALENWRRGIEAMARASQPGALPTAQRTVIDNRYAQQMKLLNDRQNAARPEAAAEQDRIRQKWAKAQADITSDLDDANKLFARLRAEKEPELATARQQAGAAEWKRDFAKRELDRYRKIRYRRYLHKMITG